MASNIHGNPTLERYEYKYVIQSGLVPRLKAAVQVFCDPDPHSRGPEGYQVTSLYLDTMDLLTYRMKRDRWPDRFKLRLRAYGTGEVFFEVKRKVGERVIKYRSEGVPEAEARRLLAGGGEAAVSQGGRNLRAFLAQAWSMDATPRLLLRYRREAYVGRFEPYARVTFDHSVEAMPVTRVDLAGDEAQWVGLDHHMGMVGGLVLMELKFPSAVPRWMMNLVTGFDLFRVGFSKYCAGVDALHDPTVRNTWVMGEPW